MSIIKRYWRIIFPIFFVLVIWNFSSHNGTISSSESGIFAGFLGISEGLIRKLAHFALFGALGYSCTSFIKGLHPLTFPKYTQIFYPIIAATIYGALDEVHQLTVSGRNGSATDVLIDALAGLAGVLAYIAFFCFYRIWKTKKAAVQAVIDIQQDNALEVIQEKSA
ncbi:MAG: VanZ family protein [Candidatus Saccharibacteria bacterium]|nr:VanZ family protein [Candidatus Saccharibacteria bacterium]